MNIPRISSYVGYSSGNYGLHALCVQIGDLTVWFSYKTPVAFQMGANARVVHVNNWGPTTGKHLNAIDGGDKKSRVSAQEFEDQWKLQVEAHSDPLVRAMQIATGTGIIGGAK